MYVLRKLLKTNLEKRAKLIAKKFAKKISVKNTQILRKHNMVISWKP